MKSNDAVMFVCTGTFSSVYLAHIKGFSKQHYALKHLVPTSSPLRIENEIKCLQLLQYVQHDIIWLQMFHYTTLVYHINLPKLTLCVVWWLGPSIQCRSMSLHICPPHITYATPLTSPMPHPSHHLCHTPHITYATPLTSPMPHPHITYATPSPHLCHTLHLTYATPLTSPMSHPSPHLCHTLHLTYATPLTSPMPHPSPHLCHTPHITYATPLTSASFL